MGVAHHVKCDAHFLYIDPLQMFFQERHLPSYRAAPGAKMFSFHFREKEGEKDRKKQKTERNRTAVSGDPVIHSIYPDTGPITRLRPESLPLLPQKPQW